MQSVWKINTKNYPKLNKNIKTDVCVVGGGISGFLTAFMLSENGYDVTLLEANKLFSGTTVNTTAFLSALQGVVYSEMEKKHGTEFSNAYFNAQTNGINLVEALIKKHNIDCDFKRQPAYLFARKSTKKIKKEFKTLQKATSCAKYLNHLPNFPLKVRGAVKLCKQASFHPLKFLTALPVNFKVYENTSATQLDLKNKTVFVNDFTVSANHIVIATHYPIFDMKELLFTKMYQSVSYCQAFKSNIELKGLYVEDIDNGLTFRNFEDKVIVGGFGHRTGRLNKINPFYRLARAVNGILPSENKEYEWMAQDCMTFDYIPFAGKITAQNNCYTITGFNKWGMANAFTCAQLITDKVMNKQNAYEKLYSLNRVTVPNSPIKATAHMSVTIKGLFKSFFVIPFKSYKKLKPGQGGIFLVKGKKRGVYKDKEGNFHKVKSKCAHMNCDLNFNKHTTTFDCVCHGSRYNVLGEPLNSPTINDIKID